MLVIPRKRLLLIKSHDPTRIVSAIPTAKVIQYKGRDLVAVKHNIDECVVLRNLGYEAPSPIKYYYDWPGMVEPFSAQKETAAFLTLHRRAYCLNDLGTGKSLSALWAYDFLRKIGHVRRALVVAPLSTMERTWAEEVFRHFPHLTAVVLHGTKKRRYVLLDQDADVYIVNHDGLEIIADGLKSRDDIGLVVVDELSQVARNASTRRWKALNVVINKQSPRMAWGLTGTPTPNSPLDAWGQCRLLTPSTVPPYFTRWRDQVMRRVSNFVRKPREEAVKYVHDAMQPAIRFRRSDCIDLPPVMYETRSVELTKEQTSAYRDMLAMMHTETNDGVISAVNEAVKINKLLQIVCGVAYSPEGEEVVLPSESRQQAVLDIVEVAEGKVIVFVPFVSALNKLKEYLTSKQVSVECVHGGVSKAERDGIFKAFQRGEHPRVLVAQPMAMSHGLTLTAANTIVWYAPVFSNDVFEQANGRITRPGQNLPQFIVMLEGSPLERKLYDRLRYRQKVQGVLLELVHRKEVVV